MKVVHSLQTILSAAAVHKAVIMCELWLSGTASDYLPLIIIIENLWIWYMLLDNISSSLSLFFFRKHINTVYSNIIYLYDCMFVLSFWHLQINDCLIYYNTLYPFLIAVGHTLHCHGKDNEKWYCSPFLPLPSGFQTVTLWHACALLPPKSPLGFHDRLLLLFSLLCPL